MTKRPIVTTAVVREAFAKEGYQLLSEYKNNHTNLDFICPKGHKHHIRWGNWKSLGRRCGKCAGRYMDKQAIYDHMQSEGYTVLEPYKNAQIPIKYRCPKGHEHQVLYKHFRDSGTRCPYCAGLALRPEDAYTLMESRGYKPLSAYTGGNDPITYKCPQGHIHTQRWGTFQSGSGCPKCAVTGFDPGKPGILYYLRLAIGDKLLYKVGITNRSVKDRYISEPKPLQTIYERRYDIGKHAYEDEQLLLKAYAAYRYKGPPILLSGNTELFTKDVLAIDK